MLQFRDLHARRTGFHHKRANARAACARVNRRPYNDEARLQFLVIGDGFVAGGHENLFAVQHPLVGFLIQHRGRANRGGVGTAARLGHRHGGKSGLVFLETAEETALLLRRTGGFHRSRAQTAARRDQVHTGIAPRKHFNHESQHLIADAGAVFLFLLFTAVAGGQGTRTAGLHRGVHEFNVIPRNFVLMLVEIPRHRAHHVLGDGLEHVLLLGNDFGHFKINHGKTSGEGEVVTSLLRYFVTWLHGCGAVS